MKKIIKIDNKDIFIEWTKEPPQELFVFIEPKFFTRIRRFLEG